MTEDYPKVRAQTVCPLCHNCKEVGLLVCWPCYHKHELRFGNPQAEAAMLEYERKLSRESGQTRVT